MLSVIYLVDFTIRRIFFRKQELSVIDEQTATWYWTLVSSFPWMAESDFSKIKTIIWFQSRVVQFNERSNFIKFFCLKGRRTWLKGQINPPKRHRFWIACLHRQRTQVFWFQNETVIWFHNWIVGFYERFFFNFLPQQTMNILNGRFSWPKRDRCRIMCLHRWRICVKVQRFF